jgi:hypothetical protein
MRCRWLTGPDNLKLETWLRLAESREERSMDANPNQRSVMNRITRQDAFGLLRIIFGCIWLLNSWFQASSAYINHLFLQSFSAGINGQPVWLASYTQTAVYAIQAIGAWRVAVTTVVIDGLLALSLLTGLWQLDSELLLP